MPPWEVVYRCAYSYRWRARSDAGLVLKKIFGESAKWEGCVSCNGDRPIHHFQEEKRNMRLDIDG